MPIFGPIDNLTVADIANIATAIGVGIAASQLFSNRKQSITAFEDSLNLQYRQTISCIPLKALLGEDLNSDELRSHLAAFYKYFDLCNEQIFLHRNKRISDETWRFWKDGIKTNLARPAFSQAWARICPHAPDDFDELRSLFPCPGLEPLKDSPDIGHQE